MCVPAGMFTLYSGITVVMSSAFTCSYVEAVVSVLALCLALTLLTALTLTKVPRGPQTFAVRFVENNNNLGKGLWMW